MTGFDTVWPADSAEFCPHPLAQDFFVCGTYKLEQSSETTALGTESDEQHVPQPVSKIPQTRRGKCLLFRAQDDQPYASFDMMTK